MSWTAWVYACVKFHSSEESRTCLVSIGPMLPMSPMYQTLCPTFEFEMAER